MEISTILGDSVVLLSQNKNANELRFEKVDRNALCGDLSDESILKFLGITDRKIYKLKFYDGEYIGSEFKIWLCPLDWSQTPEQPFYVSKINS